MSKTKQLWFALNVAMLSIGLIGARAIHSYPRRMPQHRPVTIKPLEHEGPLTVFVHGTLFPIVDTLVRIFDSPLGLVSAQENGERGVHGRIGYILNTSDPQQFPLGSFYLFGWSGILSCAERKRAAHELYLHIRNCKGPITIIGHSHGGNVALHLPEIAKIYNDTEFRVDKLILLACPVQRVTENAVHDLLFETVRVLFSVGDYIQRLAPQEVYPDTDTLWSERKDMPIYSKQFFTPGPRIIQRRILLNGRNPFHKDFIFPGFMSRLPQVLQLMETSIKKGYKNAPGVEYIVSIPRNNYCGQPVLLEKKRRTRYARSRAQLVQINT